MKEEDPEDRVDPMSRIFPFNKFSPSGSMQRRYAMRVLQVNIINEVGRLLI
jgi:hypothetical protein